MFLLEGHTDEIGDGTLAFSPDGRWLLSGGADRTVRIWDLAARFERNTLEGHRSMVTGARFVQDGKVVASCSWDRTLRFWDARSGKELHRDDTDSSLVAMELSPDGGTLAVTGASHIQRWDATTFERLEDIGGHDAQSGPVAFSSDGKWLVSGGADRTVRVWDLTSGEQAAIVRRRAPIQGLAISPDGKLLAVATGRVVGVHELPSGKRVRSLDRHNDTAYAVAFSPSGQWLLSSGDDKVVNCWDVETGKLHRAYRWGIGPIHGLAFAPDGMTAAAIGERVLAVWDLDDL